MNWEDVGKAIADFAPEIGTALLGPAGTGVGELVAHALGVSNTPDDVQQALKTDPDAAIKLKALEVQQLQIKAGLQKAQIQADSAAQASVNATMQAESANSEHEDRAQRDWRPFNGFAFGITLLCNYAIPALANTFAPMVTAHWHAVVSQPIPEFVFVAWGSVLGVTAWHSGLLDRLKGAGQS